jgi:hypothetical protein
MYRFWFIGQNVILIAIHEILGRVDFESVPICLWRRRKFCIKMRVLSESQTLLRVLETAEVPQNFLKTSTGTEHLWRRYQIMGAKSIAWHPRSTTIGWASGRELRR